MSISIASITTGRRGLPPRIFLQGAPKVGKSEFAAGAPSPVFIPIRGEEGIDDLDAPKFPVATRYADLMDSLAALYSEDHAHKTVVIDSTSTLQPLVWDQVCADHGASGIEHVLKGYGKGYIEAEKYWRDIVSALDDLRNERGIGCVLIGHVKVKAFNDPLADPYDSYVCDLQDRAAGLIEKWADATLFAAFKSVVKTKEIRGEKTQSRAIDSGRVLFTQKRPGHPGGGRGVYGRLPAELPLTWAAYADAIEAAKQAESKL